VPTTFGVITADTRKQAEDRAGGAVGNRGEEAALAALELVGLFHALDGRAPGRRGRTRR
jgi:6,7-dimethyl-8-ribityllumazine synthase